MEKSGIQTYSNQCANSVYPVCMPPTFLGKHRGYLQNTLEYHIGMKTWFPFTHVQFAFGAPAMLKYSDNWLEALGITRAMQMELSINGGSLLWMVYNGKSH